MASWTTRAGWKAVHRKVPQVRYARAARRGVECAADEVVAQQRTKKMGSYNLNRGSGPAEPEGHHVYHKPHIFGRLYATSKSPNPHLLQHTHPRASSEEGFHAPAKATDKDVARMRQGRGGTAVHHELFAQRGRRSAGGPCGRRSSIFSSPRTRQLG